MKLMPASRALATIRVEVASSVGPPNIMVPRQIGEIFRPLRPRWRYCIGWVLYSVAVRKITARDRHCERSEAIQKRKESMDCFVALLLAMAMYPYLTEVIRHGYIL